MTDDDVAEVIEETHALVRATIRKALTDGQDIGPAVEEALTGRPVKAATMDWDRVDGTSNPSGPVPFDMEAFTAALAGREETLASALKALAARQQPTLQLPDTLNIPQPIINVAPADVFVAPVDTAPFVEALLELKAMLAVPPPPKRIIRDDAGRIVGLE